MNPALREARAEEAALLSALAIRSKAWWGYPDEFMAACVEELTVRYGDIENNKFHCVVAYEKTDILGFYTLEDRQEETIELGALFVDPPWIGKGIGRHLIEHALKSCADIGVRQLIIQGDPHAGPFYIAAGGEKIGERESDSVPGRFLPLFRIEIS